MKRLLQSSRLCQWTLFLSLLGVGMIAFMVFVGEEAPDSRLTIGEFFFLKAGAFGILYMLYHAGKYLYNNGMLPKYVMDELSKEEDEI